MDSPMEENLLAAPWALYQVHCRRATMCARISKVVWTWHANEPYHEGRPVTMKAPIGDTRTGAPTNSITEMTRRAIIDYLSVGHHWSGALPEDDFLGRLYDLKRMPSTDYRPEYDNAAKDIWKHRVANSDWPDDWVFTDKRFDLLFGPDGPFLKFLTETVHPVVRPDTADDLQMVTEYNAALTADGWEIHVIRRISDKPVFGYRHSSGAPDQLEEAGRIADRLTGRYIAQQVRRLRESADRDPELAIGTAKEFLESICKTILSERGAPAGKNDDLPTIVRATIKSIDVLPQEIDRKPQLVKTV